MISKNLRIRVSIFPDFFISQETGNLKSQNSREFPGFLIFILGKTGKMAKILKFPGKRDPGNSREETLVICLLRTFFENAL